jgi:hypothetical protein
MIDRRISLQKRKLVPAQTAASRKHAFLGSILQNSISAENFSDKFSA